MGEDGVIFGAPGDAGRNIKIDKEREREGQCLLHVPCRRWRCPQGQLPRERRSRPPSAGWRAEQPQSTPAGRPRLGRSFLKTSRWWWPSAGSTWVCTWCARACRRCSRPPRRQKSLPPSSLRPRRAPTSPQVLGTTSGSGSRVQETWRSTSRRSTQQSRQLFAGEDSFRP